MLEDESPLSQIIERECRKDEADPGPLDGLAAEMAEVRIERLGTGDGQEHGAEHDDPDITGVNEEMHGIIGIEGRQDAIVIGNVADAGNRQNDEPHGHDRAEEFRDRRRAARLHGKEQKQDHHRDRHHIGRERRRHQLQPFDRRENRQSRRDDRIADEQGGARDPEEKQPVGALAGIFHQQRQQRQRAALAIVVGAQQEQHVFQGDDDRQRPDHQRDQADDFQARHAVSGDRAQRFTKRIKRAGADIAIDNADRAKGESQKLPYFLVARPGLSCRMRHLNISGS